MTDVLHCAGCNAPVPDDSHLPDDERDPCPDCGSVGRANSRGVVDMVGIADLTVEADLILGPGPRPWSEAWAVLEQAFEDIEALYRDGDQTVGQYDVIKIVNNFMVNCYHLKDHLRSDLNVPEPVRSGVEKFVKSNDSLALTGDVANTAKHRERRPAERYARVGEVLSGPEAVIHWTDPNGNTVRQDARELAQAAMHEWRTYLQTHGLI